MVFVIDTNKRPLAMCHESKARKLLRDGKAAVWRREPFAIILKRAVDGSDAPEGDYLLKIDYGSKHTGLAILKGDTVLWFGQIEHRANIKELLQKRSGFRRRRRNANLRYRKPRFDNRTRREGWLPPSLQSRVDNIQTIVSRLLKLAPIGAISYENVKFDTQLMQNPDVAGVEYQQGELAGYEVREYLLEKFDHKCAYCGKTDVRLEIEHIVPKSRGGSNRVSNLAIACHECNQKKGSKTAEEFGYPEVQERAKAPLKDAAAVTATRWAVLEGLQATGLPIECASGGRTKFNRTKLGLPKAHYYDAACVGPSTPEKLYIKPKTVLIIEARGRGKHQRTNIDKYGFPKSYLPRQKYFFGFQTGDFVKAVVPQGKYAGAYVGVVACRSNGSFDIKTKNGRIGSFKHEYFTVVQRTNGYFCYPKAIEAASSPRINPGHPQRDDGGRWPASGNGPCGYADDCYTPPTIPPSKPSHWVPQEPDERYGPLVKRLWAHCNTDRSDAITNEAASAIEALVVEQICLRKQLERRTVPLNANSTIYRVDMDPQVPNAGIEEFRVDNIVVCSNGDMLLKYDAYDGVICTMDNLVNGTPYLDFYLAFLSREDAEAALKRKGESK